MKRDDSDKAWVWADSSDTIFTNWAPTQPDDAEVINLYLIILTFTLLKLIFQTCPQLSRVYHLD